MGGKGGFELVNNAIIVCIINTCGGGLSGVTLLMLPLLFYHLPGKREGRNGIVRISVGGRKEGR